MLLVNSEKRTQDRVVWPYTVKVIPIDADGNHELPVECRGKDISTSGLGFYLPEELDTADVLIELPKASTIMSSFPPRWSAPNAVRTAGTTWAPCSACPRFANRPKICVRRCRQRLAFA